MDKPAESHTELRIETDPARIFVRAPLHEGGEISIDPGQAHHLGTVLRRRGGVRLRVFNGADGEWQARIAAIGKHAAILELERLLRPQEPEPDLWLAFGALKRPAAEILVEKATELGASALLPLFTARTNVSRLNLSRLAAIAVEAAEQSERLTVPMIAPPQKLPDLLKMWPADRVLVVALERSGSLPPPPAATAQAGLLVGPEGGFDPAEKAMLARRPGTVFASLGKRVLRAETAAIVGLALLQTAGKQ
ncbi:MAG: 16S rRNA (uracil(1498)-N(3))-methyltransferase [Acetobacteraceae bacterium]|nr:16S rRNA (uracil(1498)-N(3))-methyltransferase [Acetobacteraceae bacterium]MBV8592579.1 16S rRNA (uracil(1498)-N(3))-methyltransferase [Acetobacteraceae bacterium]